MSHPPAEELEGKPHRIHWTCRYPDCGRSFTTWTRRGLRVTCPKCHRVQEGPAGVRRLLEKLDRKKARAKETTTLTVVAVNGAIKPKAKPAPAPAAKKPSPPPPPAPPPARKEEDPILGFFKGLRSG